MRRRLLRAVQLAVLAVALLLLATVLTHQGRVAAKSLGLLVEIFPSAPVYPLRLFTHEPARTEVRYGVARGETVADLYRPAGSGRHGAIVFYIGVGPERRNPHVVRVAEGLARSGLVVLVPVSPGLARFRVSPEETSGVVAAFEFVRAQPFVDPSRIGIMGLSAGGAIVALAATDPRISPDVRLVELFGSYYSAYDLLSALALRRIQVDDRWETWNPEPVSIDVLRNMVLDTYPASDRPALRPLFDRGTASIPSGLSPSGRAMAALLVNREPARVQELIDALPDQTKVLLSDISPATRIGELRAEVFLMHDRDDHIIPFTESERFYAGATAARGRHLTELRLFRHVEPSGGNPLTLVREATKLYAHVYGVLYRLV
ncbi:MAG: prolyl oligopeptidase family serine peptidase [Chloroflexota bacterium]|nr:prolyl oligopeptidase family serine peptidase [Chloroflexota bacterium]